MKTNFILVLILLPAILFWACNKKVMTDDQKQSTEIPDGHNSKTALDWNGVYTGTLPCADCDTIKTMLTLNSDETYSIKTIHVGKSDEVYEQRGPFKWKEDGQHIVLQENDSSRAANTYHVGENHVTPVTTANPDKLKLYKVEPGIEEKYWKLVKIDNREITANERGNKEPHLIFKTNQTVNGHSGCNSFRGQYKLTDADGIRLSGLAATKMACLDENVETPFFQAIERAENFKISGDSLILSNSGAPVASFVVVYLR